MTTQVKKIVWKSQDRRNLEVIGFVSRKVIKLEETEKKVVGLSIYGVPRRETQSTGLARGWDDNSAPNWSESKLSYKTIASLLRESRMQQSSKHEMR